MPRRLIIALVVVLGVTFAVPHEVAATDLPTASLATFEGSIINLRNGWGDATACTSDGITTECFRTEAQLNAFLADASLDLDFGLSILSTCATPLRLYANTSFGGLVLNLSTRSTILNLSTWSFDNVTSSYKVGACTSTFYDGANAGAPIYPGNTTAGASATSMLSGWDNRVSSVIIS
jgi:hypothetical protein